MEAWLIVALLAAPIRDGAVYTVVPEESSIRVHVGKTGLFAFAGHEHEVEVPIEKGRVRFSAPGRAAGATVRVEAEASRIRVLDPDLDDEKRAQVQKDMEEQVLEVADHPTIVLEGWVRADKEEGSRRVAILKAELDLHGHQREMEIPLDYELHEGELRARGEFSITHEPFGLHRASAAGGTVKVAKRIEIEVEVVARREAVGEPDAAGGD